MIKRNSKKNSEAARFNRADAKKILSNASSFQVRESYNTIRTNLLFTQNAEKSPVFVVTSPTANNGKTINTINLAVSFAQMGKKTLIIDSDMRNPTVHRLFSISVKNGLSEFLAGITDNISFTKTDVENLSVLTAGKVPPNPAELLSSQRMDKLLSFAKEHFDCIFIDTPPVNIVTDSTIFAKKVTGYVLIVKTDTTNTHDVKSAVANLQHLGASILGFILNDVTSQKKKHYAYYKQYNYNYNYSYDNDYNNK